MTPTIVRVADAMATPWKNGGGTTRELLAWPAADDWIARASVADIKASGPFSIYEGVDRWFAVLSGDDVSLATQGSAPRRLAASLDELHAFAGDVPTECTALGAATQDFNIMLRRARGRLRQHSLRQHSSFESRCELIALFAAAPVAIAVGDRARVDVPGMSLAWWHNARHETLRLRAQATTRGWWFEADAVS